MLWFIWLSACTKSADVVGPVVDAGDADTDTDTDSDTDTDVDTDVNTGTAPYTEGGVGLTAEVLAAQADPDLSAVAGTAGIGYSNCFAWGADTGTAALASSSCAWAYTSASLGEDDYLVVQDARGDGIVRGWRMSGPVSSFSDCPAATDGGADVQENEALALGTDVQPGDWFCFQQVLFGTLEVVAVVNVWAIRPEPDGLLWVAADFWSIQAEL